MPLTDEEVKKIVDESLEEYKKNVKPAKRVWTT